MSKIKIRETVKDIKVIDKAKNVSEHMRDAFVRTKDTTKKLSDDGQASPSEYAEDQVKYASEDLVRGTGKGVKKTAKKGKELYDNHKTAKKAKSDDAPSEQTASDTAKENFVKKRNKKQMQNGAESKKQTIRTRDRVKCTVKQTGKSTGDASVKTSKATVKSSKKAIKATEKTTKTAIKTVDKTAKATKEAAKASVKAAQKAAQAAKAAGKAAVASAKAIAKAIAAAVKAIIAGTKALIAAIAAGGWVAVIVVIVICLVALIVGSCFGIFFSNEDTNSGGKSMTQVVSELNSEYYAKTEQIKTDTGADEVETVSNDGLQAIRWNEVLAVYAVKVTTGDNEADVVMITDDKVEILRTVMWDMNGITHTSKSETKTVEVIETDETGKEITMQKSVTETVLTINLTHRTYTDMIIQYGFDADQTEQLNEMMSSEYDSMWAQLLGGYTAGTGEIMISNSEHIPKDIFSWPLPENYSISSSFGYRADPFTGKSKFHGGLDIAAPEGTPILAAADGTVEVANATDSWGYGYGYHVKIRHNDTDETLYAHCSKIAVVNGQKVKKGQIIAYVGTTGNSTGNHLHFEVYKSGERTNPLGYFK